MMISMGWNTPAFLAGMKNTTRRHWSDQMLKTTNRVFEKFEAVDVWDKNPQGGGNRIALVTIIERPFLQNTSDMMDLEYHREGFAWMDELPDERITPAAREWFNMSEKATMWETFEQWREDSIDLTVIRFEIIKMLSPKKGESNEKSREIYRID